jgi:hypothetical protein
MGLTTFRSGFQILIAIVILVWGVQAPANDSTARVGAGGITFLKNDNIRMVEEVLEISTKTIRVRYRFLNESDQDIRTTVAFPMPPYGWNPDVSASDRNIRPLKSFKVRVDGHSVPTKISQKALIGEVDVTDQLRKIGLTESQIFETFGGCTLDGGIIKCGLTKTQEAKVAQLGGKNVHPGWKVAETAYWEQVFPSRKEIEVIHEYPPFVGYIYDLPCQKGFGCELERIPIPWNKDSSEACLDEGTRQAIDKRIKSYVEKGATTVMVYLNDVEYILGTGRNWKGPIGNFKLRIEKGSPDELISLCLPGKPERIGPSTIEFSHSNFIPQDKLVIYFYSVTAQYK